MPYPCHASVSGTRAINPTNLAVAAWSIPLTSAISASNPSAIRSFSVTFRTPSFTKRMFDRQEVLTSFRVPRSHLFGLLAAQQILTAVRQFVSYRAIKRICGWLLIRVYDALHAPVGIGHLQDQGCAEVRAVGL